ncbi:unnamed protein product [Chilo suppressalis]|uniref:Uncharacterized protein n=1 Tax=Chilo suppressalis TaxID=168631 RepID=A0ABN8B1P5_CHISP|nr:unnamed protein product [Chilo suppressalis]
MPNIPRSPLLNKSHSMSDSDVAKLATPKPSMGEITITQRDSKRRRLSDAEIEDEHTNIRIIIREELRDMFNTLQLQQNLQMEALEKHISEIKIQNEAIHKNNLEIEKTTGFISEKINEMQSTICRIEEERHKIATQITKIEEKCDAFERNCRKTSIQIRNVPKQKGETKENLCEIIQKLSSALGVDVNRTDLRDVFRIPGKVDQTNSNDNSRILINFDKEKLPNGKQKI